MMLGHWGSICGDRTGEVRRFVTAGVGGAKVRTSHAGCFVYRQISKEIALDIGGFVLGLNLVHGVVRG